MWWSPCQIYVAPSVQRCKVWPTPTTRVPCSNAAKTQNPLKFAGVPQTPEPISAVNGSKFTILWRNVEELLLLPCFSDCRYICVDTTRQSCAMVPRWRIYGDLFCFLYFQTATCSTCQTCILNLPYGHTMRGSMVDMRCATAEIRRAKKERRRRNNRTKISWPALLHRAAIKKE